MKSLQILTFLIFLFLIQFVIAEEHTEIFIIRGLDTETEIEYSGIDIEQLDIKTTKLSITGRNNTLTINGNEFSNMQSSGSREKESYILLNTKGEITEASFKTNDEGGTYTIGGTTFDVPPNTVVYYDNEIGHHLAEGAVIKEFGPNSKMSGINFILPNKNIASGTINTNEQSGLFIKELDTLTVGTVHFPKSVSKTFIYFEEDFNPENHIGEKYYFQAGNKVIMHSIPGKSLSVNYLPGNDFFNLNKPEYAKNENGNFVKFQESDESKGFLADSVGNKYRLVPDEKDLLEFIVRGENSFEITFGDNVDSRNYGKGIFPLERTGRVPLIKHTGVSTTEQITVIRNGRNLILLGDDLFISKSSFDSQEDFEKNHNGKYQSVPFQLNSPLIPDGHELRIGSNNQYKLVSPEETNSRVVHNRYGTEISEYQDEQLQTIDQLRSKWESRGMNFDALVLKEGEYKDPSPFLLQSTDRWLTENPDAILKNIAFIPDNRVFFSRSSKQTVFFGEKYFDQITHEDTSVTFDHEYEHFLDDDILEAENRKLFTSKMISIFRGQEYYEETIKLPENRPLGLLYDDLIESTLSELSQNQAYNQKAEEILRTLAIKRGDDPENYDRGKDPDVITLINHQKIGVSADGPNDELYNSLQDPEISGQILELRQIIFEETGLNPYIFKAYDPTEVSFGRRYYEVSSVFAQIPIPVIKEGILTGKPIQQNLWRQLTQLSFDKSSDANRGITSEEYIEILGNDHCSKADCSDQKCITYQLTCGANS
ncbi:MAG: hypothetical protein IH845_03325 [Nanoarchaeota archaeon]|nr:hypothetical protein [Nanoarchaeota archaeon]